MAIGLYVTILALIGLSFLTYRAKSTHLRADQDIYNTLQLGALLWISFVAARIVQATTTAMGWDLIESTGVWLLIESILIVGGAIFVASALFTWFGRLLLARRDLELLSRKSELYDLAPQLAGLPPGYEKMIDQLQESLTDLLSAAKTRFFIINSIEEAADAFSEAHATILKSGNCVYFAPGSLEHDRAKVLLPVAAPDLTWGVVTIEWTPGDDSAESELAMIQKLARLLNIVSERQMTIGTVEDNRTVCLRQGLRETTRSHSGDDPIDQIIPQLYRVLHEYTSFEILRLGVFEVRGSIVRQFCIGPNGNLLNELDRSLTAGVTEMRKLFSGLGVRRCRTLSKSQHDDLRFLGTCGAEWSLSVPLGSECGVEAIITLAGSGREISDGDAKAIGAEMNAAILPLIRHDNLRREVEIAGRNFLRLGDALKLQADAKTPEQALQALAKFIVAELPSSLCQVWTYDSARQTLTPVARAQAASVSTLMRIAETISLQESNWHRRAVSEKRYMVISQQSEELKMDDREVTLTGCPQMKSAMILPVTARESVIGAITICEVRDHARRNFTLTDIKLAQGIAMIAAQTFSREEILHGNLRLQSRVIEMERDRRVSEIFTDLPQKLATPLTSIMARSALLLQLLDNNDSEMAHNLRVIKRQAERITSNIRAITDCRHGEAAVGRRDTVLVVPENAPVGSGDSRIEERELSR